MLLRGLLKANQAKADADALAERSWLRHYATRQKVAASNPDDVIGFFQLT
jgi:hypothetical protein